MLARRTVALLVPWLVAAWPSQVLAAEPSRPPNIVILLADDMGYGDLGCYGNANVKTPNVDRLAGQGVRCTDFYATSPVCSPTRAGLLTGRYPQRNGVVGIGMAPGANEVLLPTLLKKRGYASGCFGKWHLGGERKGEQPTERGFDDFFGFLGGQSHYYLKRDEKPTHRRGTERVAVDGYTTDLYADAAIDFVQRHHKQPFLLYLAFNAPHDPYQTAPAKYVAQYPGFNEADIAQRRWTMITVLDDAVGRVLAKLDALQLTESTIVVFFSDNGGPGGRTQNKPLRGAKGGLFDGGIRVPCMVRWPGKITAGTTCREPLMQMDLFCLALAAAGVDLPRPTERMIDGRDPTQTLMGKAGSPHSMLCWEYDRSGNKQWAIRMGRYKLVEAQEAQQKSPTKYGLFDLIDDVKESKDLSAEKPDLVQQLKAAFAEWRKQVERFKDG